MDEAERHARIAHFRAEHERWVREENERVEREAAIDRCDACTEPKDERDEKRDLPNGLRMTIHTWCCAAPAPSCTAAVDTHFISESPEVANRIVERLASQPELSSLGVSWMACLAIGADRLLLTYQVPMIDQVAEAAGSLALVEFRESG